MSHETPAMAAAWKHYQEAVECSRHTLYSGELAAHPRVLDAQLRSRRIGALRRYGY